MGLIWVVSAKKLDVPLFRPVQSAECSNDSNGNRKFISGNVH